MHHRRLSGTALREAELASDSLRELKGDSAHAKPMERLRLLCLSRGANGILDLGRVMRRLEAKGNKQPLNAEEFIGVLREAGLELTHDDAKTLFETFDDVEEGGIDMSDFLMHVRPPMSEFRKSVVEKAFEKMYKSGSEGVTIKDLARTYNVKAHSQYVSGEESEETILDRFLANFQKNADKDGMVTYEEFLDYYSGISASIDNDCYFDLIMRQAYKLNTHHRRLSGTALREAEMASDSLHELKGDSAHAKPMERLRLLCLSRGANGILDLGRVMRRLEAKGHKQPLNAEEFIGVLREAGLELTHDDAKTLFETFDDIEEGGIDMSDFLMHVRPPMSEFRKSVIEKAFEKMYKSGSEGVTIKDLARTYNVKAHSQYVSGEESEQTILDRFLANFQKNADKDGMVTYEEFLDYYSGISASIDNDCYFDLIMRQAYKL